MKIQKLGATALVVGIVLTCLGGRGFAQQTNMAKTAVGPQTIATNFIAEAILSPSEIKQVFTLAKACGLDAPGEIETFYWLPGRAKGIRVKSVKRVDGRNTTFDSVNVLRPKWGSSEPGKNAKQVGDFWSMVSFKYSTILRRYDFRKESIQVEIGKGIDTAVVDKIIALIEANDVRLGKDVKASEVEPFKKSKPAGISGDGSGNGYLLRFEGADDPLHIEWKKGQVVITGVFQRYI